MDIKRVQSFAVDPEVSTTIESVIMFNQVVFFSLACGLVTAQQKPNPFNLLSAATLFTGPQSPVVDTGYGLFQGKSDQITGTENYLGTLESRLMQGNGDSRFLSLLPRPEIRTRASLQPFVSRGPAAW